MQAQATRLGLDFDAPVGGRESWDIRYHFRGIRAAHE